MKLLNPTEYIRTETWNSLSVREQYYVILLKRNEYTLIEIQYKLLFDTYSWLWRLQKRVKNKLKKDIEIYNCLKQEK